MMQKPVGQSWESYVDSVFRIARENGEFDNLPGAGKPIPGLDEPYDENWWLKIRVPAELDRYLVFKGSIAIDGISLTIASLERDVLAVTIIPHTYQNTTLGTHKTGDRVNLECDVLAKHVEKLLESLEYFGKR